MTEPTEQEKKLWLCYHARIGQAIAGACCSANLHNSAQTPDEQIIAIWSAEQADAMLAEAKKRGMV